MSGSVGTCVFCAEPVEPRRAAYLVTGWEVTRAGGGANRILGRKRLAQVAHARCAELAVWNERRGVLPGQGSLV
jgi:hypothetical protein